jgi:hypothetical protein
LKRAKVVDTLRLGLSVVVEDFLSYLLLVDGNENGAFLAVEDTVHMVCAVIRALHHIVPDVEEYGAHHQELRYVEEMDYLVMAVAAVSISC